MAITITGPYGYRVMDSGNTLHSMTTPCVGYESGNARSRTVVYQVTTDTACTGINFTAEYEKYETSAKALDIYGKLCTTNESASLVKTTNGTKLASLAANAAAGTDCFINATIEANGFVLEPGTTYYLVLFSSLSSGYAVIITGYYYHDDAAGTEYQGGIVKIYDGTSWRNAIPYVYDGTQWRRAIPYVYNGTEWKRGGA